MERVELFSLKWKKSDALNHPSGFQVFLWIKFSVQKEKVCHLIPNQNSCQVQTFYFFNVCWCLVFFLNPPKKNARFSFREICPAEIHQDSGGVVVKDTERPPAERPVDVTTTTSTTSFSKKKSRMAFVWSLNSDILVILDRSQRILTCFVPSSTFGKKFSFLFTFSWGGGKKSNV